MQSVFMGTMRTQILEWLERSSLDQSCQLCQALVGSLWHRCHKCPPLRNSDEAIVRTSTSKKGSTVCHLRELRECSGHGSRWRTLRSDRTFPSPTCTLREENSTLRAFQMDPSGKWASEVGGAWWVALGSAERRHECYGKAARPAPWPPPGHHSGGERCFRQRAGRHLLHARPQRAALLEERSTTQHQRTVHLRVDLETVLGAHR